MAPEIRIAKIKLPVDEDFLLLIRVAEAGNKLQPTAGTIGQHNHTALKIQMFLNDGYNRFHDPAYIQNLGNGLSGW